MTRIFYGAVIASVGLLIWLCADVAGRFYSEYALDLGSLVAVTPQHAVLIAHFVVLGAAGALAVALGLSVAAVPAPRALGRLQPTWVVAGSCVAGLVLPTLLRALVLGDADITDDESTYGFTAKLVASGRLSVPSPELKVFFDRAFMTNDGHYFSQYFVGWPALLAPFEALGMGGYAASYYFALGLPAVYLLAREVAGPRWALAAVLLLLISPLVVIGAATRLSHTASLVALAWTYALWLRLRRDPLAKAWWHALLAAGFCTAFFVRPYTAVAMGMPLLVGWVALCVRHKPWRSVLAFCAVAAPLAALFLYINQAQTGSAWLPAYQRTLQYYAENGYFFANGVLNSKASGVSNVNLDPLAALGQLAQALLRLWPSALGWPVPILFMAFAVQRRARLVWWMLLSFVGLHLPLHDPGVDSFGPVHYTEAVLPMVVLSAAGMRTLHALLRRLARPTPARRARASAIVMHACLALTAAGLWLYWPPRLRALGQLAQASGQPALMAEVALQQPSLVFVPRPYARHCVPGPRPAPRHFHYWWPVNSPDFDGPVVWANHISLEQDRRLRREQFPERAGFLMVYDETCTVRFVALDSAVAETIPNGLVRNVRTAAGSEGQLYDPTTHARSMGLVPP